MTDEPSQTPKQQAAEAAAIRRRWITLGEILAVVAVAISGLTLWNSYDERRSTAAERQIEQASTAQAKTRIGLIATRASGSDLWFKGSGCAVQTADIVFPRALGVPDKNTVLDHRIDAGWFDDKLLALTDGGADRREGRLPVLITSLCDGVDGPRTETAIYDIAYRIEPRFLRGRAVELRGLVRREAVTGDGRARLDALWAAVQPTISSGLKK